MEREASTPPSAISSDPDASSEIPMSMAAVASSTPKSQNTTASISSSDALPSIVDVQFYEWMHALTSPSGPYPNGIPIKEIRKLADEQWHRRQTESRQESKIGELSIGSGDQDQVAPIDMSQGSSKLFTSGNRKPYWKSNNHLSVLLNREIKLGRIKRVAMGVYVGCLQDGRQVRKISPVFETKMDQKPFQQKSTSTCRLCQKKISELDDKQLKCGSCEVKYHVQCAQGCNMLPLDFSQIIDPAKLIEELHSIVKIWKCYDCKRCNICGGSEDEANGNGLLLCDRCDSCEHLQCQIPIPAQVPYAPWYCGECRRVKARSKKRKVEHLLDGGNRADDIGGGGSITEKSLISSADSISGNMGVKGRESRGSMPMLEKMVKEKNNGDEEISENGDGTANGSKDEDEATDVSIGLKNGCEPVEKLVNYDRYGLPSLYENQTLLEAGADVHNWDLNKIVSILKAFNYEAAARKFEEQEIDGAALLLLTRQDVIYQMNLKLGPAVKAYRLIEHLQTICDNLRVQRIDRLKEQETLVRKSK